MRRPTEGNIEFQQKLTLFCLENVDLERKNLFEGDMILTDAQRMAAMFGEDVSKAGLGRASIRKNLWPGAVLVYQLDPAIGSNKSVLLLNLSHRRF